MEMHKCEISAKMVHSCRVLLGAYAAGYPGVPNNFEAQHLAHGRRNNTRLDLVHGYAPAGRLPFDDRYTRAVARNHPHRRVVHNWTPVAAWRDADRPAAWEHFRLAARLVRGLSRACAIMVHPEPEKAVTEAGTPKEYRRMWATVRDIFAEEGVERVTWGIAYSNDPQWDEVVPDLYPGDDLVDWVWCHAYGSVARPDLAENINHFLHVAARHGIGAGKPFGIAEWGARDMPSDLAIDYFGQAHEFLDAPEAETLKAWMIFDALRQGDLRVGFDAKGHPAPEQAAAYRRFTQHHRFRCQRQ